MGRRVTTTRRRSSGPRQVIVTKLDSTGPRPHEVTLRRWRLVSFVTPNEPGTGYVFPPEVEAESWFAAREIFARALPGVSRMSLRGEEIE